MSDLKLGVNIDHVATIRQARYRLEKQAEPDVLFCANEAIRGGADSITAHLREDRRHIQDHDIVTLKENLNVPLNLEMANVQEIVDFAIEIKPKFICLVPEKRIELTTEGGINAVLNEGDLTKTIRKLKDAGIMVSLFVDPDLDQIRSSVNCGANMVELHTGNYANAVKDEAIDIELQRLVLASEAAHAEGLQVNAGHGITASNLEGLFVVPFLSELNVGHHLIARAIQFGLRETVSKFKEKMLRYDNN
ncbi:MAG: pyridoxine 5'-phosphate synthase [Verrucomicrobiales bacterium]|nr:pyridoxine 5'-phosphate synthase [Verrucomicrobiales bacterium]|tara:strand:- start:1345 stop:2091 length:747 start_codon:yes stop_codon:yes gene_type:complete